MVSVCDAVWLRVTDGVGAGERVALSEGVLLDVDEPDWLGDGEHTVLRPTSRVPRKLLVDENVTP